LAYDGFSIELFSMYTDQLEKEKVPIITLPYREEEMKRVLVERGVLTEGQADRLWRRNTQEHWRGPTEFMEDEKHQEEMKAIIESQRTEDIS
jgi:hypothetical protein